MKIWFISDTHQKHGFLKVPEVDMIIHAGDVSNVKSTHENEQEVLNFICWFKNLDIKHKIWIAGNHDTSIEAGLVRPNEISNLKYQYLEHNSIVVDGLRIFGSPYTPAFNNWAFNVKRSKSDTYWQAIPDDCDILITHGPPLGILDHTQNGTSIGTDENGNTAVYSCGDKSLLNHIKRVKPKIHVFGHIHDEDRCFNAGITQVQGLDTKFINASVVDLSYKVCNNGYIIEI